jgi:hypothetical protein
MSNDGNRPDSECSILIAGNAVAAERAEYRGVLPDLWNLADFARLAVP